MKHEQIHLIVTGRVQGVGFRYSTRQQATALGLSGWVRNTSDGRVEIEAAGETPALDTFLQWCHEGPPPAHVVAVELLSRNETGVARMGPFEIR